MRPLYIVGTQRNVGKTMMSIGLVYGLRQRGLGVAYIKPLGQRFVAGEGHFLHDDARLLASFFGPGGIEQVDMAVPLPTGRVEQEIQDLHTPELMQRVADMHASLARTHDVVIVEGMGHVAMGGCLGMSSADVCRNIGGKALLVSGGGIGRAIDDIFLCATFIRARGADLAGAIVNKVWQEKFDRVQAATTRGLMNLGIRSFGTVPFQEQLSSPTMRQVHQLVGGELLGGGDHLHHRVARTIVGAMQAEHMIRYIQAQTLIITPGDRSDNIQAALREHQAGGQETLPVSGLILTGDFRPDSALAEQIRRSHLPVIAVKEDTYTTASKIINTVFKILPEDRERIEWAIRLVVEHVDVGAIAEALGG